MPIEEVKRARLTCTRCGYSWYPRGDELPKTCANPKCKSPYWNVERKKIEVVRRHTQKDEGGLTHAL